MSFLILRSRSSSLVAILVASLVGCSLFTSLDDLQSDGGGALDATSDAPVTFDASSDAAPADGDVDADVDAGSWAFLASNGVTVNAQSLSITSDANVRKGDLVVLACDAARTAQGLDVAGYDPAVLPFITVGPADDAVDYEAQVSWGVANADLAAALALTVSTTHATGFVDCTLNVYRGGAPNVVEVAEVKTSGPRDSGLATCGPIATTPGGVAVYVSARTACVGAPVGDTFTQRQALNGNASGDAVPTDGETIGTTLADCMGSKEDWVCLTVSLSP